MDSTMRKFYMKEIPESPVIVNGVSMRFDILETEDPVLIRELDNCITRGIGGVMAITEAQYAEELKKKESGNPSVDSSKHKRQRQELAALPLDALRAAGVVDNKGQFAGQQTPNGRAHTPRSRGGLPTGGTGPSGGKPEPIEVPAEDTFAGVFGPPPTAAMKDLRGGV